MPMKTYFFILIFCYLPFTGVWAQESHSSDPSQMSHAHYFDMKAGEKENDRFLGEFMNMLTTLGIIVVIILIATWFLKRMVNSRIQQLNTTSVIKIVERRTLTPKTSLYLLDINGMGYILSESTNGVTSLGSFNVIEMESQKPQSFDDLMKNK